MKDKTAQQIAREALKPKHGFSVGDLKRYLEDIAELPDETARLRRLIRRVRKAQLAFGPTSDGTLQGKEFELACDALAGV